MAYGARAVVVEGYGVLRLIELAAAVDHIQHHLGFVAAEAEDVVECLGVFFLVDHGEDRAGARGVAESAATDAEHEGLYHHAAELHLARHVAYLGVTVVHTVGDDEYQVTAGARGGEVGQSVRQRRRGCAAALWHESLDLALQLVDVVTAEGHLEACAKLVLVEVAKDAQRHVDIVLLGDRIQEGEQHLLRHLNLGVALPVVPHGVGAVHDEQQAGLLRLLRLHGATQRQQYHYEYSTHHFF